MDNNIVTLSFVDKSIHVNHVELKSIATIKSGFRFTKFDSYFERFGFKSTPSFVVDILEKNGYTKDYGLNMWVTETMGVSKCDPEDEYDKVRGYRISVSRAKKNAYINASNTLFEITEKLYNVYNVLATSVPRLCKFAENEDTAINNVITYGVSNPKI